MRFVSLDRPFPNAGFRIDHCPGSVNGFDARRMLINYELLFFVMGISKGKFGS